MKIHEIDLNALLSKGHVDATFRDDMLHMTITKRPALKFWLGDNTVNSYIYLPGLYKLPLRIDITLKIDSPEFYLFFGEGHLSFGSPWSDNRRIDDIIEPTSKPRFFHNHIPMNKFSDISVIYDFKEMQILVNGEERYYSPKERYMKSKRLGELNDKGFMLKLACSKRNELAIKSIRITEYEEAADIKRAGSEIPEPVTGNLAIMPGQKPDFKACISMLPPEIIDEIIKTDEFLLALRPMKFRRQIEKHGNKITYVAKDNGFSYAVFPGNDVMYHSLSWYIIHNGKPETWHRKADMMEEALNKAAENSPELAGRLFYNLKECIGCYENCMVKTPYEFDGRRKTTCHGLMEFKMCVPDFEDARAFISVINEIAGSD